MEKLTDLDFRESVMIAKINEIVDWCNSPDDELFEGVTSNRRPEIFDEIQKLKHHYHAIEAQDRDITTGPRYEP